MKLGKGRGGGGQMQFPSHTSKCLRDVRSVTESPRYYQRWEKKSKLPRKEKKGAKKRKVSCWEKESKLLRKEK